MPGLPAFKKFNKIVKDLLDIDYDFSVTDKKTSASGIEVETTLGAGESVTGGFKVVVKENDGELTSECQTSGEHSIKYKRKKVADGMDVTVQGTWKKNTPSVSVTGDLSQDQVLASINLDVGNPLAAERTASVKASVVGGADGFSGGVQVTAKVIPTAELSGYDLAAQYVDGDMTATVTTAKKLSLVNLYLSLKHSSDCLIGAHASYNLEKKDEKEEDKTSPFTLTVGTELNVDDNTTFTANVNTAGLINTALSYGLSSPECTATFSTQFQCADSAVSTQKFGVGLEF